MPTAHLDEKTKGQVTLMSFEMLRFLTRTGISFQAVVF